LVYSGNVFTKSKDPKEYLEIDRYYNNIIGIGFIGFFEKNHRVGVSWSWGYTFSKNPHRFYPDYFNANLGITIKIASFEKEK